MSWVAIAVIVVGGYLAIKLAGFAVKLGLWLVVAAGLYWLLSPYLGLPLPV